MTWFKRKLAGYILRSFQKELGTIKGSLKKEEEALLLSGLWQNQAFRNYLVVRENACIIAMANNLKKPSDEEYQELFGRRLEILDLYLTTRNAFNAREKHKEKLAKDREKS